MNYSAPGHELKVKTEGREVYARESPMDSRSLLNYDRADGPGFFHGGDDHRSGGGCPDCGRLRYDLPSGLHCDCDRMRIQTDQLDE